MRVPWSYWWRARLWGWIWIYQKLWDNHPFVVILAALGVLFLLRLALW